MLTDDKDCSCDFFVLVTARSARHIEAVAESILKLVSALGMGLSCYFFIIIIILWEVLFCDKPVPYNNKK